MSDIGVKEWQAIFAAWEATMKGHAEYLIALDGVAGDSDLGLTMSDGFSAANKAAAAFSDADLGKLFYSCGKAIMNHAPSSLGTLLGSGFLEAGKRLKGTEKLTAKESVRFWEAIEENIMVRGHSKVGDKTFLDGLDPAIQILKGEAFWPDGERAALEAAAQAAENGAEHTREMVARHGRMAIRGEDSIGMLDPGAVVGALLVRAFADTLIGMI